MNRKNILHHKWSILYLILLPAVVVAGWFATGYLGDMARRNLIEENEASISLFAVLLTDETKRIEGAVASLAGSPWIAPALITGKKQDIALANSVLDRYNSTMGASESYLMNPTGFTIASSNRSALDSYVGKSYRFSPYFEQAISGHRGRYFAIGVTSLKRGFYASHSVQDGEGSAIGVVVMKKELDHMEAALKGALSFFIDPHGIIFLSSKKEMLFKSLWPVGPEAERALLASKQFGDKPFEGVMAREISDGVDVKHEGNRYVVSRKVIDPEGWSVVVMGRKESIFIYKSAGVILTALMCALLIIPLIVNYKTVQATELLRESEIRFRELFNTMRSGVIICRVIQQGEDFIITDINPAGERISQVSRPNIFGKKVTDIFPGVREFGLLEILQDVWKTSAHQYHPVSLYKDERISQWVENNVYMLASGEIVVIYDDVTDKKRMEDEIRTLAITDPLTGLYNRRGFLALAEKQLKIADRTKKDILLFYIDLDGMKWINDNLGHKAGDNALIEVASVLRETFRSADILARVGGDEFAVLAVDMTEGNTMVYTVRLQSRIDQYNGRENRSYVLSLSVGCSRYHPENPCSLDELMARADGRMYTEKKRKREESEA